MVLIAQKCVPFPSNREQNKNMEAGKEGKKVDHGEMANYLIEMLAATEGSTKPSQLEPNGHENMDLAAIEANGSRKHTL